MKNIYKFTAVLLLALIVKTGLAQHMTPHGLYTQHRMMVNPANVVDEGMAFADFRNQWTGVESSPVSYLLGVQSPFGKKKNMGLGLLVQRDEYGVFQNTYARVNYAYNVKLAEDHYLAFALSGGFADHRIPFSQLYFVNGVSENGKAEAQQLTDEEYNGARFDAGFGMKYNWKKKFELGFALPEFFESSSYEFKKYFLGMASYKFNAIQDKMEIEPSVLFRYYQGEGGYANPMYDLNLYMCYANTIWAAGTYRAQTPGFIISAGVNLYNFGIGYGYHHSMNEEVDAFGGTHEVLVSYYFGRDKKKNKDLLNNNQIEMALKDTADAVTKDDYQAQIDSLRKEIETLRMLLQVKDLKDWADGFKDKIDKYNDAIDQLEGAGSGALLEMHVLFDEGKYNLKSEYFAKLDEFASLIKTQNLRIEVVGHANSNGGHQANQILSEKRANVVAEYLVSKGAPKSNLITVGYGEDKPIASNKDTKGRAMNRRVQFRKL